LGMNDSPFPPPHSLVSEEGGWCIKIVSNAKAEELHLTHNIIHNFSVGQNKESGFIIGLINYYAYNLV
jgi:hypothetical protein